MTEVAGRLSGGAGSGVTSLIILKHWLFNFDEASSDIRHIVAEFVEWLANENPPWSAYHTLMSGHLIIIDKHLGVRPAGLGETW